MNENHGGRDHYQAAEKLMAHNHAPEYCWTGEVRCDNERATVHALLAQAHALAAVAAAAEKITRLLALIAPVEVEETVPELQP